MQQCIKSIQPRYYMWALSPVHQCGKTLPSTRIGSYRVLSGSFNGLTAYLSVISCVGERCYERPPPLCSSPATPPVVCWFDNPFKGDCDGWGLDRTNFSWWHMQPQRPHLSSITDTAASVVMESTKLEFDSGWHRFHESKANISMEIYVQKCWLSSEKECEICIKCINDLHLVHIVHTVQ